MTDKEKLNKLLDLVSFDEHDNMYINGQVVMMNLYLAGFHSWVTSDNEDLVNNVNK